MEPFRACREDVITPGDARHIIKGALTTFLFELGGKGDVSAHDGSEKFP